MQAYLNFIDDLVTLLPNASNEQKQNVAFDICRKLIPFYQKYSESNTDIAILKEALELCEQSDADSSKLVEYITKVEGLMPETTEIQTWDESYAINAVGAICELLQYRINNDNQHIIEICSLMVDNIDFELAEENDDISDEAIYAHHKMQGAMQNIKEMLK